MERRAIFDGTEASLGHFGDCVVTITREEIDDIVGRIERREGWDDDTMPRRDCAFWEAAVDRIPEDADLCSHSLVLLPDGSAKIGYYPATTPQIWVSPHHFALSGRLGTRANKWHDSNIVPPEMQRPWPRPRRTKAA